MRPIYTCLFYLSLPFLFMRLWWKGRKSPGYRLRWRERLGYVSPLPMTEKPIWIHAVSLGEMIAAKPLIHALRAAYPDTTLLITTTTVTGSALAQQYVGDKLSHYYLPYDLPGPLTRFLDRIHPQHLVLMETELWPNLLHYTAERGIPTLLANARLSPASLHAYLRILCLTRQMCAHISCIAAQTQADADRFMQLGAKSTQIQVMGNIKFDLSLPGDIIEKGRALRHSWGLQNRPVLIAASTHVGEEEVVLAAFHALLKNHPETLLILVPRHPERFEQVEKHCQTQGYRVLRRTQNQPCLPTTQIWLGDTFGELFLYYAMADIAFIGGSLVPTGGHNPLEAAALGMVIITGPHTFNFIEIFSLLQAADAVMTVTSAAALCAAWETCIQDIAYREERGKAGQKIIAENRGAVAKHMAYLSTELSH